MITISLMRLGPCKCFAFVVVVVVDVFIIVVVCWIVD